MYALYGSARSSGCERQGYEDEYKPGTCEELLKWKFAHLNSVDFLLRSTAAGTNSLLGSTSAGWKGLCGERHWNNRARAVPAGDTEGPHARLDAAARCMPPSLCFPRSKVWDCTQFHALLNREG